MLTSKQSRVFTLAIIALVMLLGTCLTYAQTPTKVSPTSNPQYLDRYLRHQQLSPNEKIELSQYLRANPGAIVRSPIPPHTMELNDTGGPDSGGYSYWDNNNDVNGPTYNWIDLSSTGTTITYGSYDDGTTVIPIGFSFPFYGVNYTRIAVSTNLWMSVTDTTLTSYTPPTSLPSAATTYPRGLITAFGGDGDGYNSAGGTAPYFIKYQNFGSDTLVVQWYTAKFENLADTLNFEAILVSNGNIIFQYHTITNPTTFWTGQANPFLTGIDNPAGTIGLQATHDNSTWAVSGRAIVFYRLGPPTTPVPANNSTSVPTNTVLSWTAGLAAAGYNVAFGTSSPPTVVSTLQTGLTYSPTLTNGTTYYWQVTSLSTLGANPSTAASPIWTFTTGAGAAPNAPTNGAFVSATTTSITGSFTDNSTDETSFPVTKSTDGFTFTSITPLAASASTGTVSMTDNGLLYNSHYWYRIYAQNAAAMTTNYASFSGWTLANVPDTASVISTGITSGTIAIHNGGNPVATQFAIYDSATTQYVQANGTFGAAAVWQTMTQWGSTTTLTGLTANSTHYIKVKARNGINVETALCNSAAFTTQNAFSLPFNEGFLNVSFPPSDWSTTFTGTGTYRWERPTTNNGNGGTNGAAYFNTYYATSGDVTVLWTPPVSTVGVTGALLSYDWWYSSPYTTGNDSLIIVYSTDGGTTYTPLATKYGNGTGLNDLRTCTDLSYYYVGVNTTGWLNSTFALPAACIGQSSIKFGFRVVKCATMYTGGVGIDNVAIVNNNNPRIAFNLTSVAFTSVPTNMTTNRTVYVKNIGGTTLHISNITATSISPSATSFSVQSGDSTLLTLSWTPATAITLTDNVVFTSDASNGPTTNLPVTGNSVAHSGGPDGFGYRFKTSLLPDGPTFNWIDIATTGTEVGAGATNDDGFYTGIPIGFTFPFYGNTFTQVNASSNGFLGLGTSQPAYSGTYPSTGNDVIAPAMGDNYHYPTTRFIYQTFGNAPNRYFVFSFINEFYISHNDPTYAKTFQVIMYEDGHIVYQYLTTASNSPQYSFIGIDDAGSQASFNLNGLIGPNMSNFAVAIYTLGQPTSPVPANSATNVPTNTALAWSAGLSASAYNVFLGTANPPVTEVLHHFVGLTYAPTLASTTTYFWKVVSLIDTAGSTSVDGPVWTFTTGSGAAPAAPTDGEFVSSTLTTLTGSFSDNANNETGFPITKSVDGTTFNTYYTAPASEGTGVVSLTDTGLTYNTHYWYRIYSQNANATSINYASVNGWTLANTPDTASFIATGITAATIALHSSGNPAITQFAIYDSVSTQYVQVNGTFGATEAWQTLAQWGTTTALNGLTTNTTYYIKVKARNGANVETPFSNSVTFTTTGAYTLPFSQNFSSTTFPPGDWTIVITGGTAQSWGRQTSTGGTPAWAYVPYMTVSSNGQHDYLISPPINTSSASAGQLSFNWGYMSSTGYHDTLHVGYSTDGGTTWNYFWTRYGTGAGDLNLLVGDGDYTDPPTSLATSGLAMVQIPQGALGLTSVQFAFIGCNTYGQNIYVTNIQIYSLTTSVMTGHVSRANNVPVDSVNVTLTNTHQMVFTTQTDVNGNWLVNAVTDTYSVVEQRACLYPTITHSGVVLPQDTLHLDGDTLYAPAAAATPTSLEFMVAPGGTATLPISLSNSGDWPTDFQASIEYPEGFDKTKRAAKLAALVTPTVVTNSSITSDRAGGKKPVAKLEMPTKAAPGKTIASLVAKSVAVADDKTTAAMQKSMSKPTTMQTSSIDELNTEVIIGTGTNSQSYPFYNYYWYTRTAMIYTAAELGRQGSIDSLGWWAAAAGTWVQSSEEVKIYLLHTTDAVFTSSTYSTYQSTATLVKTINPYSGALATNNWDMIALDNPFQYNGTDNLMVLVEVNQSGYSGNVVQTNTYTTTTGNTMQYWYQDTSQPTGNGNLMTSRPNIRFEITTFDYASISPEEGQIIQGQPFELSVTVTVPDTTPDLSELSANAIITTNACTTLTIPVLIHVRVNAVKEAVNLPREYKLYQNYPNPFNPTTEIRFDLKNPGMTKLTVYNSLGQEVTRLVSNYLPAGFHSVRFKADRLATGVYFYRLESGSFTSLKKMVMVK